jgi:hypothetical protein
MSDEEIKILEVNAAIKGIESGKKTQYHLEKLIYLWTTFNDPLSLFLPRSRGIVIIPTDYDLQVVAKCLNEENQTVRNLARRALELGAKAKADTGSRGQS